jgi:small subunit ribosomal protein S17
MSEQETEEQVEMVETESVEPAVEAAEPEASAGSSQGRKQTQVGVVLASPMDKTAVVAVQNTAIHKLYRRRFKRTAKFYAHDPNNETRAGDQVVIVSARPTSKTKRWRVSEILQRAEEA